MFVIGVSTEWMNNQFTAYDIRTLSIWKTCAWVVNETKNGKASFDRYSDYSIKAFDLCKA